MPGLETPAESLLATRALRAAPSGAAPSSGAGTKSVEVRTSATNSSTVCKADIVRDDLTGLYLGQYALGTRIGSGGMGKVFRARHMHLDRVFAIKFMSSDLSAQSEAQERFERETLALGRLQHPLIVNAVDAGSLNGLKYLVTEFIEGEDLAQLVQRRGTIPLEEACDLIRQVAIGLDYSHTCGFVHRDIKPSNLIVNRQGVVTILDFGLVRDAHPNHQLTTNRELLGTWDFLAPEQAQDASQVDHRCDIYSLGCTLLYLLSGQVPFSNSKYSTPAAKLKGHLFDTPTWLRNPPADIPPKLVKVLKWMLAKSPHQRYAVAGDVVEALAPFAPQSHVIKSQPSAAARAGRKSTPRISARAVRTLLATLCVMCVFGWLGCIRIQVGTDVGSQVVQQDEPLPEAAVSLPSVSVSSIPADRVISQKRSEPIQINSLDSFMPQRHPFGVTGESDQSIGPTPRIVPATPKRNHGSRRAWYSLEVTGQR